MQQGICHLSVIPIRKAPDDTSELTTQLLFGETFRILGQKDDWLNICIDYDHYEGWIDRKQMRPLTEKQWSRLREHPMHVALELVQSAVSDRQHVPLLIGSNLPRYDGMHLKLLKEKFVYHGQAVDPQQLKNKSKLLEKIALKYLNAPYLWGGRGPFGIDCSGFTQIVFKLLGVALKRDAWQQAAQGKTVHLTGECKPGDLAFFQQKSDKITHVGILLSTDRIIHASGRVRIDRFDQYGIYREAEKQYSHQLRLIKRVL